MTAQALNKSHMIETDSFPTYDHMAVFTHAAEVLLWSEVAGDTFLRGSCVAAFAVTLRAISI